jgi:dipeptide/tripeptide permease
LDLAQRLLVLKTGFTRTFWVANVLELFERFAFYGSKAVLAIYLAEKVGLGTTGNTLMGLYGFAVFGLPILAGPVVDRFGFRKSLTACFSIFCAGYFLIGFAGLPQGQAVVSAVGKLPYVVAVLLLTAIGGSLIKPCIVGTVARTTSPDTKSLGYSIYYTLVNVGGAMGPILALQVREEFGIEYVLVMSSFTSFLLVLGTLVFFREPEGAPVEVRTMGRVFADAALVFRNARFITFLVIFSGFWVMFWQVFLSLPFYVRDVLHFEKFEILETVDAWSIIVLTVPVAALMKKVPPILAMTAGFAVASASWLVIAFSASWQGVVVAMFLFALGEATQAPRFYEYVADLAPKDQIGTFMGFAFLPVAIGYGVAGPLSGFLVQRYVKGGGSSTGMWVVLSVIGFGTTALMILYDRLFVVKDQPAAAAP